VASTAQILANRQNAQLSTGPKTIEGKAASSSNSTRHGLSGAGFALLPHENREEFEQLLGALRTEFKPCGDHESFLVEQMAKSRWRLIRIERLESEAFDEILTAPGGAGDSSDGRILHALTTSGNVLDKLQRYAAAAERSYYKAVRELETARARQKKAEATALDTYIKQVVFAPVPGETREHRPARTMQNEAKSAVRSTARNEPEAGAKCRIEDLGNLALRL
jgi:hypothetical protein